MRRHASPLFCLALAVLLLSLLAACRGYSTAGASGPGATSGGSQTPSWCLTPNPGKINQVCSGTPVTGHKGLSTCDGPSQPTCPPMPNPDLWVRLSSTSPADVLAAMQACPDYISPVDAFQLPENSSIAFDPPVLVRSATTGPHIPLQYSDYFVVRVLVNGVRAGIYSLSYDPAGQRISMSSFGMQQPNDPNYGKHFPWEGVSSTAAAQMLQSSRGVTIAVGTAPELVYFDLDPRAYPPILAIKWTGGGNNDVEPIWRLLGADGKLYFVGTDAKVYAANQLPIAPGDSLVRP